MSIAIECGRVLRQVKNPSQPKRPARELAAPIANVAKVTINTQHRLYLFFESGQVIISIFRQSDYSWDCFAFVVCVWCDRGQAFYVLVIRLARFVWHGARSDFALAYRTVW